MAVSIPDKDLFKVENGLALYQRCVVPNVQSRVDEKVQLFYKINVSNAVKELTQVGKLLQLAYSGSKGFSCNVFIIELLSKYQNMVKDSSITTSTFVEVTIKALKLHTYAIKFLEKKKHDLVLKQISKCEAIAEKMIQESDRLIVLSDELCKLSEKALINAADNNVSTEAAKRNIIESSKRLDEEFEKYRKEVEDLAEEIQEREKEELKAEKAAESARMFGVLTSISNAGLVAIQLASGLPVSSAIITMPCFEKVGKNFADKGDRESAKAEVANKERKELQQQKRVANAELSKLVQQLKNTKQSENELDKSIKALEVAIKSLGKIKTVFLNAKVFWVGVRKHCASLTDFTDMFEDLIEEEEMLLEELKVSGISWLALGKINYEADRAMQSASQSVDGIMSTLPSQDESKQMIAKLADDILKNIEIENGMME